MKSRRQFLTASAAVLPALALSACANTGTSNLSPLQQKVKAVKNPVGHQKNISLISLS